MLVVIAVVALAWDARMDNVEAKTKGAQEKIATLEEDRKQARAKLAERAAAETAAAAFYEVVRSERQKDIIEGFEAVQEAAAVARRDAVLPGRCRQGEGRAVGEGVPDRPRLRAHGSLARGRAGVRGGREPQELGHAHPVGEAVPGARLQGKLDQRDAIPLLMPLSEASPDPEVMDDATFLLAECFIDIQAYNDAKTMLRAFVRRFPDSPLLNDARMALADLSIKH